MQLVNNIRKELYILEYKNKKIWQEAPGLADPYRQRYVDGIGAYVKRKNQESNTTRKNFMSPEKLVNNPEYYRQKFRDMLGLNCFLSEKVNVPSEMTYVGNDDICRIYRLTVYITDEIPFYALLLIPHHVKLPMPLTIAQHGGGGTPELCCDIYGSNNYSHMAQRALERGHAVLAPQLLLWNLTETPTMRAHNIPQNRKLVDLEMKRFGSSITALEISGIIKTLDYVCHRENIDEDNITMIGLSYGGYFTLHTMAADTRIKAGYCAGVFNNRNIYNWFDWTYKGSALTFQDAEVAALCAPRKLYIQVGKEDQVFDYHSAIQEAERVKAYFEAFDASDHFRFDVWEGGHTISGHDMGYDFIFSP